MLLAYLGSEAFLSTATRGTEVVDGEKQPINDEVFQERLLCTAEFLLKYFFNCMSDEEYKVVYGEEKSTTPTTTPTTTLPHKITIK